MQWDSEVFIYVDDSEINQAYNVHFFNITMNEAYVMESAYEDEKLKVKIPNELLTQPYAIVGYIEITNEGEKKSLYRFRINIIKKPKPSDMLHVDTNDYVMLEGILEECKTLEQSVKSSASEASSSAESATASAEAAEQSKTAAESAKEEAVNSKTEAAGSATKAQSSASEAEKYAKEAKSYAVGGTGTRGETEDQDNAKYYAEQAKNSATEATNKQELLEEAIEVGNALKKNLDEVVESAQSATQSATDAAGKATTAAGKADTAAQGADTAAEKANTAAQGADSAKDAATQAAASATEKATEAEKQAKAAQDAAGKANTAAGSANDAAESATSAAQSATEQASAAEAAATKANTAAGKADEATTAAGAATEKANAAAQSATEAAEAAQTAKGEADAATKAATEAATEAQKQAKAAESAASSATEAAGQATEAANSVNDAIQAATKATEAANTAAESANTAASEATVAAGEANTQASAAESAAQRANDAAGKAEQLLELGGLKLYEETGQKTDGAMTQKAVTDELAKKADQSTVTEELAKKADKSELANVKITLDDEVTAESENAVKSSGIHAALEAKADKTELEGYVPTTRKVAGKALSADVTLAAADVGAVATSKLDVRSDSGNSYIHVTPSQSGTNHVNSIDFAVEASGNHRPWVRVTDSDKGDYSHKLYTTLNKPTAADVGALWARACYNNQGTDYNTLTETGWYNILGSPTKAPNNPLNNNDSHFLLWVHANSPEWVRQVAYDVRSTDIYTRIKNNGTWNPWLKVAPLTAADVGAAANINPTVTGKITVTRKDNQLAFIDIEDTTGNVLRMQSDSTNKNVWIGHYNKSTTKWVGILWANHTAGEGEAYFNGTAKRTEQITASTSAPQSLANGAICLVYE